MKALSKFGAGYGRMARPPNVFSGFHQSVLRACLSRQIDATSSIRSFMQACRKDTAVLPLKNQLMSVR